MNTHQKHRLAKLVAQDLTKQVRAISGSATQPTVCVFGFAYKKNTSDTRMSQSAYLINHLASVENIKMNVHDAKVLQSSFEIEMEAQGYPPNPMV